MRGTSKVLFCLLALFTVSCESLEKQMVNMISVRIVPTRASKEGGRIINLSQPFYVVITNVSDKPIRLWREWCSWGYNMLSFQFTDQMGKISIIKKAPRAWTKNYPDKTLVPPGEHMVFAASLLDGLTWSNMPLSKNDGVGRKVSIRAIFEIPPDQETRKHNVWTGKVLSPEHMYTLY